MAWQTPKTNWAPADVPLPDDFNRIEGNVQELQNTKETPAGAQGKANTAETNAKNHANGLVGTLGNLLTVAKNNAVAAINEIFGKVEDVEGDLESHKADGASHSKTARFIIGTSTAGWTAADCDYLCDGTADQVEINNAITALPATGGEIVILDGTYNITAKIDVTKDNVSIRGNGNATILKRMFNSSVKEGVITLTSRSGCKIANLQIDGNAISDLYSSNYGIYLDSSNDNTVTGNTCTNNTYGICLEGSSNNTVTGNAFCYNSLGIRLDSSSNHNAVTSNICNNNNSNGIYLEYSSKNTITDNTCNNNDYGIYLGASNDNTVTGNTCNNNNSNGIYLEYSSNNTVTGNTCNNNDVGIYFQSSINNTVTGNTCVRGTGLTTDYTSSQYTIQLSGTGNSYNLIAMNNCMGKAVTSEGGTGNTLVYNKYNAT
jgi:parallel beta-helix repeat protein